MNNLDKLELFRGKDTIILTKELQDECDLMVAVYGFTCYTYGYYIGMTGSNILNIASDIGCDFKKSIKYESFYKSYAELKQLKKLFKEFKEIEDIELSYMHQIYMSGLQRFSYYVFSSDETLYSIYEMPFYYYVKFMEFIKQNNY
jgi:hypothetical protein